MRKQVLGQWLRRGGIVALAMTTIMAAGCGGGGGGGGSTSASNSSGSGSNSGTGTGTGTGSGTGSTTPTTGANSAPTINATPATQVIVGSAYDLTPQVTDVDGDALAFAIENRPAWAEFNTATGRLSGTPTAANAGTTAAIVISVSDGKTSASLPAFSITVGTATASNPPADPPSDSPGVGAELSWQIPTQTVDGQPLSDLAGYRIHYGTKQDAMVRSVEVPSAGLNKFKVENLAPGTYYFAVRAVTSDGTESDLSNVISRVIS